MHMISRLRACLVLIAAEARRACGGRRAALGEPVSTDERLTIRECAGEACCPRNGSPQVPVPAFPVATGLIG
jgi:hypothetical protein